MSKLKVLAIIPLVLSSFLLWGQVPDNSKPMDQATIKHDARGATVTANDARPLDQTIQVMREEYGWILDYEDPVYSASSLTDITDKDWPSRNHPQISGLKRPTGGAFKTTYPEYPDMDTDEVRSKVVGQVLTDYMKSGNPGKFELVRTAPSRFDIIGLNESAPPVLDTLVAVNVDGKNTLVALDDLLNTVQAKTGHSIGVGFVPTNLLGRCIAKPEISQGPARTVLLSMLGSCDRVFTWRLLYDANSDTYLLNIAPRVISPKTKGN